MSIWPCLQRLKITAGILAPSGKWYYTGDPDDDDDEGNSADHEWQNFVANGQQTQRLFPAKPNATLDALLLDFADAASSRRMPSLCWACLDVGLDQWGLAGIMARRMQAGQALVDPPGRVAREEDDIGVSQLGFWVGKHCKGWHVPAEFVSKWEDDGGAGDCWGVACCWRRDANLPKVEVAGASITVCIYCTTSYACT